MILSYCPTCRCEYRISLAKEGKVVRCHNCGDNFRVPVIDRTDEPVCQEVSEGPVRVKATIDSEALTPCMINYPKSRFSQ